MKLSKLILVEQPTPVEPEWKMCIACNAYKAECLVPVGEGSAQMCWICAHLHVEHDVPIDKIIESEICECSPYDVYPYRRDAVDYASAADHVERLKRSDDLGLVRFPHGDGPARFGPSLFGHFYNQKTGEIERRDLSPVASITKDLARRKPS